MHPRQVNVFRYLRSHKGAWMLVFAAILIKVMTATACMLDGPRIVDAAAVAASETATQAQTVDDRGDDCLLGESGGCHCACAHAMTLPAVAPSLALTVRPMPVDIHPPVTPSLRTVGSLLRPPIA